MMPNITRGQRISGVLVYLVGPGKRNEHTEPHVVAGDVSVVPWRDSGEILDKQSAVAIARVVDQPRKAYGVELERRPVWHCSLSLAAEEGELSDETWGAIASDFVAKMGLAGDPGRDPCRWVAVRHGLSAKGNDHIHVVVSLVREDGTEPSVWRDFARAQRAAGELERKYGLQVLASRELGRGSRGFKPGEIEAAERRGSSEPARASLGRIVRGCATASADEADFVRRVRDAGVWIRPRYAPGGTDVVVGYSVALAPAQRGEGPVWYAGGRLARDLTITRLRADWPDNAAATLGEWRAAYRGFPSLAPRRERGQANPALSDRHDREIAELRERLRSVPAGDSAAWAQVAGDLAGIFAAASLELERTPGPLARLSDALARSAQLRADAVRGRARWVPSARGAAMLLAAGARGGRAAQIALVRQLANTTKALHDAHLAAGDARRAKEIETAVRTELSKVIATLSKPDGSTQPATVSQAIRDRDRRQQQPETGRAHTRDEMKLRGGRRDRDGRKGGVSR